MAVTISFSGSKKMGEMLDEYRTKFPDRFGNPMSKNEAMKDIVHYFFSERKRLKKEIQVVCDSFLKKEFDNLTPEMRLKIENMAFSIQDCVDNPPVFHKFSSTKKRYFWGDDACRSGKRNQVAW